MKKKSLIPILILLITVLSFVFLGFNRPSTNIQPSSYSQNQNNDYASLKIEALRQAENYLEKEDNKLEFATKIYKVSKGDTLTGIWTQLGDTHTASLQAAKALKASKVNINSFLKLGDNLEITLNRENKITSLAKEMSEGKKITLNLDNDSNFIAEIFEPAIIKRERIITARIIDNLATTAEEYGLPYEIVDEIVDLFGGKIEFSRDIHLGDSFSVIYEERILEDGKILPPSGIIAASFMNQGSHLMVIKKIGKDGKSPFFDETGEPVGNYFLRYPLNFTRISSVFSHSRFHPVLKSSRPHNGVDFAAPIGTPVRSVADGRILEASYHKANGNWIKIKHTDRYSTNYLHLNSISKGIKKGSLVKRGQVIGTVGKTGLASGPHLHFGFYDYGKYVDPLKVKLPSMSTDVAKINQEELLGMKQKFIAEHNSLLLIAESSKQNIG